MLGRYFAHCRITLIIALVLTGTLTVSRAVRAQDLADTPKVIFSTTLGNFVIELYPDIAPITVKNFLAYVDAGFFENTIFHRVIPGVMIQGGGFTDQMQKKPTNPPI
ncbi:MAG: peptidylprolyl isomerase, partial [Candidatus Binatia bacterium]